MRPERWLYFAPPGSSSPLAAIESRAYVMWKRQQKRLRKRAHHAIESSIERVEARWAYYGGKCWMCGRAADAIDHVKPVSRGGSSLPANLRPACTSCNSRKGARWPL